MADERNPGSFRDPWGFIYRRDGRLLRQVAGAALPALDQLHSSGLYDQLTAKKWLVPHEEVGLELAATEAAARVIAPEELRVLSWPYEWCFSALKAAALLTLEIAELAVAHGMVLRDASAYNVQFRGTQPVFIDTLSFGAYEEGSPWVAYGQFCRHFLAPLALMAKVDVRLGALTRSNIDGIPLDLASSLLPMSAWMSPGLAMHIKMHARSGASGRSHEAQVAEAKKALSVRVSKNQLLGMLSSLKGLISGLEWTTPGTTWGSYYANTNYSDAALDEKAVVVKRLLETIQPKMAWDLGGNTGRFTAIANEVGSKGIAFDMDPVAVEAGFRASAKAGKTELWHLQQDLGNPSPSIGWDQAERPGIAERGPADVVLGLALVHHLAIGNNVPLSKVFSMFRRLGKHAIVEFVPKDDSQVVRMLSSREDVFDDYTWEGFEAAASEHYTIIEKVEIAGTVRAVYLLEGKP